VPTSEAFSTSHTVNGQTPLSGALGIIGATVMPHNLYLHSSVVQSRKLDHNNKKDIARAIRFSTFDSNIQLTVAFFVNSLLLIMGVA
ncbi:divalent metal cation transporter, partial [Streptococcus suis]